MTQKDYTSEGIFSNRPVTVPRAKTSSSYWVNMQARYDLLVAREQLTGTLEAIRPRESASA